MTGETQPLDAAEIQAIDAEASGFMKRGIRILSESPGGSASEALACFDRALELRSRLPIEGAPRLGYGRAACWINRADALMRLGDPAQIALAIRAYDEAIVLLRALPLGDDARFPRRLAIAHHNRGLALLATDGLSAAAATAFTEAITILDDHRPVPIADRAYLLATAWMNLARTWSSDATAEADSRAHDAAQRAIALVAEREADDADAAEVGLKARHVLCQTIARQLSLQPVSGETGLAAVHEATDVVDDGLRIVRHWEHRRVARFRDLGYDLFRFGARVFETYQPHFLEEFILENIDPDRSSLDYVESPEMRAAIQEAVLAAARQRQVAAETTRNSGSPVT